jgi:Ino eighty subunit 1
MGTNRVLQKVNGHEAERDADETEEENPREEEIKRGMNGNGDVNMEDDEVLDDMEKEILGLGSGEDEEVEEDLDDVDKELLGLGGDETEEEGSEGGMDVD